jgi:putative glutamine amidotransferase
MLLGFGIRERAIMKKPIVGVIGNAYRIEDRFAVQMAGENNLRAVAEVAGALPIVFASVPGITDIGALLDVVDGVLLTGARANVHPTRFQTEPHPSYEPYDERRDAMALSLIEACVARSIPVFGICRGFQEMNVAFGGSLHPEIRELPGRQNHRMPRLSTGSIRIRRSSMPTGTTSIWFLVACLRNCLAAKPSASTRCTGKASLSLANAW